MITYNHAPFISQAIEGTLMQKTNFSYELIIGEDHSTDDTLQICLDYQKRFPDKINVISRKNNIGMMPNFIDSLRKCQGKYIALCEGDDYWTDPLKLQKQIDFLENNPAFAICFHQVEIIYENSDQSSKLSNPDQKEIATFEDLARDNFIYTVSCIFRNNLFKEFPDWFQTSKVGDWVLHLLNAQFGKIKYFDDVSAVYRIHEGGVWGMADLFRKYNNMIEVVENCRKFFAPRANKEFRRNLNSLYLQLLYLSIEQNHSQNFRKYFLKFLQTAQIEQSKLIIYFTKVYFMSFSSSFFNR